MKYKLNVVMKTTQEQFEKDLRKPLKQMGKDILVWGWENNYHYVTSFKNDNTIGNYNSYNKHDDTFIDHYNPELFLALAAMTDKEDGNVGEWWKFTGNGVYSFTHGKLYRQIGSTVNAPGAFIDNHGHTNGFYSINSSNQECFVKATQEEIIKEFKNNVLKEIKMKNRILTPKNAQRIIDIACTTWKRKLAGQWAAFIVLGQDIIISEDFYTEMRKACTTDQNEVFDEIFGSDEQLINISELKIGESMIVYDVPSSRWNGIIISRIWTDDNDDAVYVNMNNTSCTWTPNPQFKGKKVKLTITHEEVK
jgi:hypothetical protein